MYQCRPISIDLHRCGGWAGLARGRAGSRGGAVRGSAQSTGDARGALAATHW